MATFIKFLQDFGLLIARIGLGAILLLHGWLRWQGEGQGVAKQVEYLNQFGTPYPEVAAWTAIIFELVGGIFLIVGALTPLVGIGIVVQQVLTIAYTNWFEIVNVASARPYNPAFELNITLGLLGLVFVVFGAGKVSIDRLFRKKSTTEDDEADTPTTPIPVTASSYRS
ncbi:MAG TPA: DoxX family protein [Propionibacteriaceae bacterium]